MSDIYRYILTLDRGQHSSRIFMVQGGKGCWQRWGPEPPAVMRETFNQIVRFVFTHPHVFLIPRSESPSEAEDDSWFEEHADWLDENCPSYTRLGPLIGIQDPDEAFAWRMRWGGV